MTHDQKPLVLLYNPKVAHPGYHRLPHSLLQLGALLEGRYPYAIVDGNLDQERDHAGEIIAQVRRDGVRYLGVTIMPGPQLQRAELHPLRMGGKRRRQQAEHEPADLPPTGQHRAPRRARLLT